VKTAGIGEIGRIMEGRVGLDGVRVTGRCVSNVPCQLEGSLRGEFSVYHVIDLGCS
jgi:hypothetical protein